MTTTDTEVPTLAQVIEGALIDWAIDCADPTVTPRPRSSVYLLTRLAEAGYVIRKAGE